jgi:hypothetical protein
MVVFFAPAASGPPAGITVEAVTGEPSPERRGAEVAASPHGPAAQARRDGESPFAPVFGARAATLAPVLREQFLLSPDAPYRVAFTGTANRVWHRPWWLGSILWALGRARILFADTGQAVPAALRIAIERDQTGAVRHVWRRTFRFPQSRPFDAELRYDPSLDRVVERLGVGGALEVVWQMYLLTPRVLVIVTEGMALRLGRRRLWLPRRLCPDVRAIEQVDAECEDRVHVDLRIRHSLLGPIFGYDGTFRLTRLPRETVERRLPTATEHTTIQNGVEGSACHPGGRQPCGPAVA